MTTNAQSTTNWRHLTRGIVTLLGIFAGLCTVFALLVSVGEAWQQHVRQSWPETTATIKSCDVGPYVTWRKNAGASQVIDCRIHYVIDDKVIETRLLSRSAVAASVIQQMVDWANDHAPGSSIAIRYDPQKYNRAIPAITTDMPYGGSTTPNNLRVVRMFSILCVVLLAISWMLRPRTDGIEGRLSKRG